MEIQGFKVIQDDSLFKRERIFKLRYKWYMKILKLKRFYYLRAVSIKNDKILLIRHPRMGPVVVTSSRNYKMLERQIEKQKVERV